jgi:hypothetical protein
MRDKLEMNARLLADDISSVFSSRLDELRTNKAFAGQGGALVKGSAPSRVRAENIEALTRARICGCSDEGRFPHAHNLRFEKAHIIALLHLWTPVFEVEQMRVLLFVTFVPTQSLKPSGGQRPLYDLIQPNITSSPRLICELNSCI